MKIIKFIALTILISPLQDALAIGVKNNTDFERTVISMKDPLGKIIGNKTLKNFGDFDVNISLLRTEIENINTYFKSLPTKLADKDMIVFKKHLSAYHNLSMILEVNKAAAPNLYFGLTPPAFNKDESKNASSVLKDLIFAWRDSISIATKKFNLKASNIPISDKLNNTMYALTAKEGIQY